MIRTNQTIRITFLGLLTIVLLAHLGCKPVAKETTGSANATSATDETSELVKETGSDLASTEQNATADSKGLDSNSSESKKTIQVSVSKDSELGNDNESEVISGDLDSVDWKSLVGQQVTVKGELVVVDTWDLIRRGQIKVARSRLYVPTSSIDPNDADPNATTFEGGSNVAKVTAAQKQNDKGTIIIDDGSAKQNIFPPKLFPELGKSNQTVRVGTKVNGVSGKLVKAGRALLLVPNEPLNWVLAKRPERPEVGKADVTVASFNVLNYFTTIDNGKNRARGADSDEEFQRQEAKLVAAIIALQSDVVGVMEIENNIAAENQLVAALNKKMGKDVFAGCGLPEGFQESAGGKDAIRVGIIYRSDRVTPIDDVTMISDDAFSVARTPVVQRFKSKTADSSFAVIVNHFKSKGGSSGAEPENKNKGDGQGAFNAARRAQSLAICKYIDDLKQSGGESRVLVIGDLNAYGQEDPIDAMRANGLVDLQQQFSKQNADENGEYSFLYRGQSGSLDHAMATDALADDVTGIGTWHINADEPRFLDYNLEFNPKPLFKPNPFRSSDHDPVIIGIRN